MAVLYKVLGFLSVTKALLEIEKQQDKVGGYNEKGRGMCLSMKRICKALGRTRLSQHTRQARVIFNVQLLFVQHLLPSWVSFDLFVLLMSQSKDYN